MIAGYSDLFDFPFVTNFPILIEPLPWSCLIDFFCHRVNTHEFNEVWLPLCDLVRVIVTLQCLSSKARHWIHPLNLLVSSQDTIRMYSPSDRLLPLLATQSSGLRDMKETFIGFSYFFWFVLQTRPRLAWPLTSIFFAHTPSPTWRLNITFQFYTYQEKSRETNFEAYIKINTQFW